MKAKTTKGCVWSPPLGGVRVRVTWLAPLSKTKERAQRFTQNDGTTTEIIYYSTLWLSLSLVLLHKSFRQCENVQEEIEYTRQWVVTAGLRGVVPTACRSFNPLWLQQIFKKKKIYFDYFDALCQFLNWLMLCVIS